MGDLIWNGYRGLLFCCMVYFVIIWDIVQGASNITIVFRKKLKLSSVNTIGIIQRMEKRKITDNRRCVFMELKQKIINTAILLLNLLEHCDDEELIDYVVNAIWSNDTMALYDLEDTLFIKVCYNDEDY